MEKEEVISNNKQKYTVTFSGFETKEQAMAFASWYEGEGEQNFVSWGEEQEEPFSAYSDSNKHFYTQYQNGDVEVFLRIENL